MGTGEVAVGEWDRRFREAHDWAKWHGFATAWPNFHEADYGDGVVRGTFLVPDDVVDWQDVPRSAYGNAAIGERFPDTFIETPAGRGVCWRSTREPGVAPLNGLPP